MAIKFGTSEATFKLGTADVLKIYLGSTVVWENSIPDYLCFTAQQANSTVELKRSGNPSIANTAYSRDGRTWTSFSPSTTAGTNTITLANVGDKVYFRNDILANCSSGDHLQFVMSGMIAASGNCNSLYSSTEFETLETLEYTYCFAWLFDSCYALTSAPDLPAKTLSERCYGSMFYQCSNLLTGANIGAVTAGVNCFRYMYGDCHAMTSHPDLVLVNLANLCCNGMFDHCTSLVNAPALPATTLVSQCYYYTFNACTSLVKPPHLPATVMASECYYKMFIGCTSLVYAPEIPATTLSGYCFYQMFYGCTSLQVSDTQTESAPYAWRIPTSGTFAATLIQYQMFTNCAGTRSSDDMAGAQGQSYTYYTQNQPV